MNEVFFSGVIEICIIIIFNITNFSIIKKWRNNKNKLNLMLLLLFNSMIIISILNLLYIFKISIVFTIGLELNLQYIITIIIVSFQLEFLLYLKKWKRFYTLPIVSTVYLTFGFIFFNTLNALIFYGTVSSIFVMLVLLKEGLKNKNGLLLTLAIFFLTYNLALAYAENNIGSFIRAISTILMLFGTSGFVDRYLLKNKQFEKEIKNIWVSRMVGVIE